MVYDVFVDFFQCLWWFVFCLLVSLCFCWGARWFGMFLLQALCDSRPKKCCRKSPEETNTKQNNQHPPTVAFWWFLYIQCKPPKSNCWRVKRRKKYGEYKLETLECDARDPTTFCGSKAYTLKRSSNQSFTTSKKRCQTLTRCPKTPPQNPPFLPPNSGFEAAVDVKRRSFGRPGRGENFEVGCRQTSRPCVESRCGTQGFSKPVDDPATLWRYILRCFFSSGLGKNM